MALTREEKILQAIGLATKAHAVVAGQRLLEWMATKKVFLVVLTKEMGLTQKKKVVNKANYYKIEVMDELVEKNALNKILGQHSNVAAIGISDLNLANLIKSYQD